MGSGVGIQKFRGNVVVAKRFAESNAREDLTRVLKRSIKGLQRQDLKRLVESAISKKSDMRNMQFYSMVCIEQDQVLEKVPRHNFIGSHHRNDDSTAKKKKALLESAEELWKKRNHHVKAYKAIEIWEKATILYPVDTLIHLNLLYAYNFMAEVHSRWHDNAKKLIEVWHNRGIWVGKIALDTQDVHVSNSVSTHELKRLKKREVELTYWYILHLRKLSLNKGIMTALANKKKIKAGLDLLFDPEVGDEKIFYGAPYRERGVFLAKFSRGEIKASGQSFDKAIMISPHYLNNYVLKARYFATKIGNKKLFKALLKKVIKGDINKLKEIKYENKNTIRIAKEMLSNISDYF